MRSKFPYQKPFVDYLAVERNYSVHTQRAYVRDVTQFFEFASDSTTETSVSALHNKHLRFWIRHLAELNRQSRSIHRKVSSVRTYAKFLYRQKHIKEPLNLDVKLPRISKKLPTYVKENELNQLLSQLEEQAVDFESYRNFLMMSTFYHTGIRRSELIELNEAGVDLVKKEMKVMGKGNKERIIPFNEELADQFWKYLDLKRENELNSEVVFCREDGSPLRERWVYQWVKDALRRKPRQREESACVAAHFRDPFVAERS